MHKGRGNKNAIKNCRTYVCRFYYERCVLAYPRGFREKQFADHCSKCFRIIYTISHETH